MEAELALQCNLCDELGDDWFHIDFPIEPGHREVASDHLMKAHFWKLFAVAKFVQKPGPCDVCKDDCYCGVWELVGEVPEKEDERR